MPMAADMWQDIMSFSIRRILVMLLVWPLTQCIEDMFVSITGNALTPYLHQGFHGSPHTHRHTRDCQPGQYGNSTYQTQTQNNKRTSKDDGTLPLLTVKQFYDDFANRIAPGNIAYIDNPLRTFSVLEPGGVGGCESKVLATVAETAEQRKCIVATNAGFYKETGECFGNIISDGRLVRNSHGVQNAHFGIREDGTLVFGYLSEEDVLSTVNPFVQLIGGVGWLLREGQVYLEESKKAECTETEATGDINYFFNVLSARTAIASDRDGRLIIAQIDGQTAVRGIKKFRGENFLLVYVRVTAQISNVLDEVTSSPPIVGVSLRYAYCKKWGNERANVCRNMLNPSLAGPLDSISETILVSLPEFAEFLLKHGAYNAINLDGGGSATFVVNRTVTNYPSDHCSDKAFRCSRKVATVICVHEPDCIPANCSSHGQCITGECHCHGSWQSPRCDVLQCGARNCSRHGICTEDGCQCEAGYQLPDCSELCGPGTYGNGCRSECQCQHGGDCDPLTGECSCMPGYTGQYCNKICPYGFHGPECKEPCNCRDTSCACHHITGICNISYMHNDSTYASLFKAGQCLANYQISEQHLVPYQAIWENPYAIACIILLCLLLPSLMCNIALTCFRCSCKCSSRPMTCNVPIKSPKIAYHPVNMFQAFDEEDSSSL